MNYYTKQLFLPAGAAMLMLVPSASYAQQWDDPILVSQCNEQYTLTLEHGKPIVKNSKEITYQSNSTGTVRPETDILYGEFITLDDVSGRGQRTYHNVTP